MLAGCTFTLLSLTKTSTSSGLPSLLHRAVNKVVSAINLMHDTAVYIRNFKLTFYNVVVKPSSQPVREARQDGFSIFLAAGHSRSMVAMISVKEKEESN